MENLVIVSKVKKYIKDKSNFQTAKSTVDKLSEAVAVICDRGIESAKEENRKTVMEKDIAKAIEHM